jgi:hypothetical protein
MFLNIQDISKFNIELEDIIQAIKPEECKIYQLLCNARDKRLKDK